MFHNMNTIQYKTFIIVFLFLFTSVLIFILAYNFNLNIDDVGLVPKILFFDKFLVEYIIVSLLLLFLVNTNKISLLIALIVFLFYVTVASVQLITFIISREFLSKLAVSNVEFIGFLITFENIMIIVQTLIALFIVPFLMTRYIMKHTNIEQIVTKKIFVFFLFLIVIAVYDNHKFINNDFINKRDALLTKNYFQHTAPIQAFVKVFEEENNIKLSFTKDEVSKLRNLGYHLDLFSKYPLVKDKIFDRNIKFEDTIEKPNIIIIFTEGFSARTTSVYSNKYENITPNLKEFSENNATMLVENFYNHTAATYRGLHGQLCSLYPFLGGGEYWFENDFLNLSKINYKCLPHILKNNGYETTYLNMHYKDESGNDDMVSHFGFDTILSGEDLSHIYLSGINKIKSQYLSDHQSYKVLENYLKSKENMNQKPFLLTTYTVETHAFLDIDMDGIAYKDGKNNILNTIHNLDDAFGKFWEYFKSSKYFKNTIIVFTSDHAHYYGKEYINLMQEYGEKNYHRVFIDKVPLLIYSPSVKLPKRFDAQQATSVDLAPTILNLLNVNNEKNAFIGHSILEKNRSKIGISSYGRNLYMIKGDNRIYVPENVEEEDKETLNLIGKYIKYMHQLEKENRIYSK